MKWPPLLTERIWARIEQAAAAALSEEEAAAASICRTSAGLWRRARTAAVIPALKVMVWVCLAMSVMLFAEKISMAAAVLFIKLFRCSRPRQLYQWEPLPATAAGEVDPELGCPAFPFILVQIPMFNEREVYHLSIRAVCALTWPPDRLIIQVLDDSTDKATRDLVEKECERWREEGMNIQYITRDNRNGYKAGALREAMEIDDVKTCDYVAIFDADHQPPSDFLLQTIPFLIHNPDLALVQARWKFVNADECLMTRIQEMSLNYHFKVEQESGSSTLAFFGFNGTAGVWRISAINEAKGWKDRTTVEDMDLAIRACLQGWKFVYVGELKVKSELPSTYKAYRYQQHRWACGPANLFRKTAFEIMRAKKASIWRKLYLIYNFFLARRIVSHIVTFFFYCVVIPLSCFFPEVRVPVWGVILIPAIITLLNAASTPRSLHLMVIWIFFETVMSFHRCKAVFIGLLQAGRVNEWIVTEKLGSTLKVKTIPSISIAAKFCDRFHFMEIGVGIWLMLCAWQDFSYTRQYYYIYVFPSSIAFIIMGCGYVGR
ncbi:Glucomannan 4-beta-mannosyltransferase 9 [Platanthera zijinensis]|uniref:glucomannan 4-beta-mannosyltransferase n=1 Tax=Platanthera zijinensis TaxID=2320716 RepID=A0AAP0GDC7_9ASPA